MRNKVLLLGILGLAGLLFLIPMSVIAQTKTSGTCECGKSDPTYSIPVPDEKGFSYAINQTKCTWPKSYTVAGLQSTNNLEVGFDEQMGTSGRYSSSGFTQYKNGDKAYWKFTATYGTKTMLLSGTWTYTRGTGKLLGIKGSGTSNCKMKSAESGGGTICEVKGEYTLPAAHVGLAPNPALIKAPPNVQSVKIETKKIAGIPLNEVVRKMLVFFSMPQGGNDKFAYVATYNIIANGATVATAIETVSGSNVSWSRNNHSARLEEHSALFNIYDILNRIAKNELKSSLEGVDEATREATKRVADSVSETPEYVRLIAEDNTDRYELTLERFDPNWIPVVLRQQKKNDPKRTVAIICPLNGYAIHSGFVLPEVIKILNPNAKGMIAEYRARLSKLENK
jgi:hypothetical protein